MARAARLASLLALGCAALTAGCNSYPAAPAEPAFDTDVLPIFQARCVRCHGAGGNLNLPTEPTGPNAPEIASVADAGAILAASHCYLNRFSDNGQCNASGGSLPDGCQFGASTFAGAMPTYIHATTAPTQMPPAPAPPLDDYEMQTIDNWAKNPICSHSATPDPSICPPGA
jgi:hypothetical protein